MQQEEENQIEEEISSEVPQEHQNDDAEEKTAATARLSAAMNEPNWFDEWIKETPRQKYIRLKAGEPQAIRFKSGRPNSAFPSDFNGKSPKPVPVARFLVTTPQEPKEEVAFDVTSKRLAADIKAYYEKGFTELEITKLNTNPTSYRVVPVIARMKQQQMAA